MSFIEFFVAPLAFAMMKVPPWLFLPSQDCPVLLSFPLLPIRAMDCTMLFLRPQNQSVHLQGLHRKHGEILQKQIGLQIRFYFKFEKRKGQQLRENIEIHGELVVI